MLTIKQPISHLDTLLLETSTQGVPLEDILQHCKEGDKLECVRGSKYFTVSRNYGVERSRGVLCIPDNEGELVRSCKSPTFIKIDSTTKDRHDTWGIGKAYKAPKKEWQTDVMNVDLTKKIWEW